MQNHILFYYVLICHRTTVEDVPHLSSGAQAETAGQVDAHPGEYVRREPFICHFHLLLLTGGVEGVLGDTSTLVISLSVNGTVKIMFLRAIGYYHLEIMLDCHKRGNLFDFILFINLKNPQKSFGKRRSIYKTELDEMEQLRKPMSTVAGGLLCFFKNLKLATRFSH